MVSNGQIQREMMKKNSAEVGGLSAAMAGSPFIIVIHINLPI